LQQLTHERDLLQRGLQAPTAANDKPLQSASGSAKVSSQLHALEARIQLKRAERAERKRALETDFAAVFKEVCSVHSLYCSQSVVSLVQVVLIVSVFMRLLMLAPALRFKQYV
jgi:hypothetical protein